MVFRAAISVLLHKVGVSGVTVVVALFVYIILCYGHVTTKLFRTMLMRSCS